ncbi:MAG: polysaccharide biosynthesis protein [Propionibacteriaceae bacterium]|jgi:dTDP-glucose 4,6-dehydratase|nr:polysaccharide biosynthesis protein [Propionibacteriaceae bacterium]
MPTGPHPTTKSRRTLAFRAVRQFVFDWLAWGVAAIAAATLRYEFDVERITWWSMLLLIGVLGLLQLACAAPPRLYRHRYHYGSFEEVLAVVLAAAAAGSLAEVVVLFVYAHSGIPRTVVIIAYPIALVLMLGVRYVSRLIVEATARKQADSKPAIVFGAGYVGSEIVRQFLTDSASPFRPVALLDDDPAKRHSRIRSVDVIGPLEALPEAVEETGARALIVAIGRADSKLLRRVSDAARPLGLSVKVVPTVEQMLNGARHFSVRDLSIDDLIGRQPVDTNLAAVGGYLTGKRVLVTGAGGSIGVELCRQVRRFDPAELIMLDRDETGLQNAEVAVSGHGLLNSPEVVLADIRDADVVRQIFAQRRPEVVFHAAALKHLPMLQQYPREAWKTNVLGTLNVLEAARAAGVRRFVNISTDKAADPTSALGYSKLLAEKLTAYMARETGAHYLSVRFGNVLGSRGSMLPLFAGQIERGGPVQVTHEQVSRYFMTIPEACQLVLQAGAIGKPGEALILDMGEPVLIMDIARRMIDMSGKDVKIEIVGLREGEKLNEQLVSQSEDVLPTEHKKISCSRVEVLDPADLDYDRWLARLGEAVRAG